MPTPSLARRRPRLLIIALIVAATIGVVAAGILVVASGYFRPAPSRSVVRPASATPLPALSSASEYLTRGDWDFDQGDYDAAIADYTSAIALKPDYAEAFNNRAYTNMWIEDYAAALPDLNQAIALRPDYITALMNRGDIYNYYYQVDRAQAIADYDRVLAIDPTAAERTSVCGHRAIAVNGGWNPIFWAKVMLTGPPRSDALCAIGQHQ